MNKLLVGVLGCLAAFAVHAQDWGGGYVGASLGRLAGKSTWSTTQLGDPATCAPGCFSGADASLDGSGAHWAGHAGYNWAFGRVGFVGLEGGVGNAKARGRIDYVPGWNDQNQLDSIALTYDWNASIVGRVGFTAGPVALYGLAGPSWQKVSIRFDCPSDPVNNNSWCTSPQGENRQDVRFGWVGGVGAEFRLPARWRARLDYRYAKYEDKEYSFFGNSAVDQVFAKVTLRTSVMTLGVSYAF